MSKFKTLQRNPYSTEQGIFAKEQGICTRETAKFESHVQTDFRMRFSKSRKEQSTPPTFDHSRDIHAFGICFGHRTHFARSRRPSTLLEMPGDRVRNEPGSNGIHVPVAMPALLMGIKPLRHDHV
jgi:hypothetical protein